MADNRNNDPFTRAYDAINAAFAGHAPFAALVKPGNRINLRVIGQPQRKRNERDGDWPEEFLKLTSINADLFEASSTTVKFSAGYQAQISSGSITVETLTRVYWECLRALFFAGGDLGLPDIVQRVSAHRAGPVGIKEYFEREQWIALLNINVSFAMNKNAIRAYPAQDLTPLKR